MVHLIPAFNLYIRYERKLRCGVFVHMCIVYDICLLFSALAYHALYVLYTYIHVMYANIHMKYKAYTCGVVHIRKCTYICMCISERRTETTGIWVALAH